MPLFDREYARKQLERLRTAVPHGDSNTVSVGEHICQLLTVKPSTDQFGRAQQVATFQVSEGPEEGAVLRTPVWGHAERLVAGAGRGNHQRYLLSIYLHRTPAGKEYRRVNVEAIRLLEGRRREVTNNETNKDAALVASAGAASEFSVSFACVGGVKAARRLIDWATTFSAMARNEDGPYAERVVFLSVFTFTQEIAAHQKANNLADQTQGKRPSGSLRDYSGPCFAPLLTFDIDSHDANDDSAIATSQKAAAKLLHVLHGLGIAPNNILIFFSGRRGFHIAIPSALAGAVPVVGFHLIAKAFCRHIADQAGVSIDESIYKTVQPLRAPNSRHEKSGLFKIWLTHEELAALPFKQIQEMATQPRVFEPPAYEGEPIPQVSALWQRAEQIASSQPMVVGDAGHSDDNSPRISRVTWDYLLNAAPVGERATAHFAAAANLADFGSVDELVRALMQRPAVLSGLPASEADSHVESALRRANTRRVSTATRDAKD